MTLATRTIEGTFQAYKGVEGLRKDDSFALCYLEEVHGVARAKAEKQIAFGGNPFGIDAYHFDAKRRNFYIFQFKWSDNYYSFKDPIKSLVYRGMDSVFGGARAVTPDSFLTKMLSFLNENRSLIDQVLFHFVFNGDPAGADQSEMLMSLVEELEGKKHLIDEFFGNRPVTMMLEFRSNSSDAVGGITHNVRTHKYKIDFNRSIASETPSGEKLQVGFMKLSDLHGMYSEMGARFFDKNIRSGLSSEKPTNKAIRKSLESIVLSEEHDPEAFLFNHNGVTLAAEHFEIKSGAAYITEPRLLNGAQTVTTLADFIEDCAGKHSFEENLHILDRIRVLGKVVSSADHTFVSNVTICNNRQNPVEPWNLRANDTIQLEYQEKFRRDKGIYYERQEGAFQGLTEDDLDELGLGAQKAVEIKRLAQTILATQGEIDKMSRLRYVFENDTTYNNTFKESYLKANAQRIILAYKVQFRTNAVIRDIMERWPNKYHYLGRAKNLVWALLIQGLFNEDDVADIAREFGSGLTIEVDFVDLLKDLGSKRIRFIVSELTDDARVAEMIDLGNFSFLRTKAAFQKAMQISADRFGWSKKSFK